MRKLTLKPARLYVVALLLLTLSTILAQAQQTIERIEIPCVFRVEVDNSNNTSLDNARLGLFNSQRWRVWAEFDISALQDKKITSVGFRVFNDWSGTQITSLRYTSIQPSQFPFLLDAQHTFANKYEGFSWTINPDDAWTPSENDFFRPTREDWLNWKRDSANPGSAN